VTRASEPAVARASTQAWATSGIGDAGPTGTVGVSPNTRPTTTLDSTLIDGSQPTLLIGFLVLAPRTVRGAGFDSGPTWRAGAISGHNGEATGAPSGSVLKISRAVTTSQCEALNGGAHAVGTTHGSLTVRRTAVSAGRTTCWYCPE
jgi:hypothetical protein